MKESKWIQKRKRKMVDKSKVKKIIEEIKEGLEHFADTQRGPRSVWTSGVKSFLDGVASKNMLECTYTENQKDRQEWLYDFIMYEVKDDVCGKKGWKIFNQVYLCAESEWNTDLDAIQIDFDKLLVARSPIKLMVYCATKKDDNEKRQWLERIVDESDMSCPDETYILAACVGKEEKFSVYIYHKGDSKK
jgi:hypothetical protein